MEIIFAPKTPDYHNILVLEDERIMQYLYRRTLSPVWKKCFNYIPAYTIDHAMDCIEHLEKFDTGVFYAILDYNLPDGRVERLLDWSRKRGSKFHSMVITSDDSAESVEKMCEYKDVVDAYIVKPTSVTDLRNNFNKYICPSSHKYGGNCYDCIRS